jgi:hypothetical protein
MTIVCQESEFFPNTQRCDIIEDGCDKGSFYMPLSFTMAELQNAMHRRKNLSRLIPREMHND